jgi:hypothetical protein
MVPVAARLGAIRGSIKRLYALDGLARLLLALSAFVVVSFLADWALVLPSPVRLVLLAGAAAIAGWIFLGRVARPLGVRITDDDLALFVERHYPELNDRLISAIQLSREPLVDPANARAESWNSPELVEALVRDAEEATASLDFKRVIVGSHVARTAAWGGLAALAIAALSALFPVYSTTYLKRIVGGSAKWPQRTHLSVLDFENHRRVIARGEDTTVAVEAKGRIPGKVVLRYAFKTGEEGSERMIQQAGGGRFQYTFTHVGGPFTFTVEGGDDLSETHEVDTVTPPSLEVVRLFFEYPAYMKKANTPADRPETAGNVVAPFHTQVRFEGTANEDLESALLSLGVKGKEALTKLEVTPASDGRARAFSGSFAVTEDQGEYGFQLKAKNGLGNRDPIRYAIKGLRDRAPEIKVIEPLGDEFVTDQCERPLEIEIRDDFGISRIALEVRTISQVKDRLKDWTPADFGRDQNSRAYGETFIRSEAVLDVAKHGLQAGDHVELRFRAEDYRDVGDKNSSASKVYKLSVVSVVTLEKELQDAIEKIKTLLKAQKAKQENAWSRTGRLLNNFGKSDALAPEQQSEVRQAGLEQNDITSKLDAARKDVRHIMRRGVYNRIFNESAASKLQGAIDELDQLVGTPGEAGREGISRHAAARLDQSAKLKSGAERSANFRDAQNLQSQVASGIQRALEYLDKWSSYQEVIRIAREIKQLQDDVIKDMKKLGGGK